MSDAVEQQRRESDAVLARSERNLASVAERLLVEHMHRLLDQQGIVAFTALSPTIVPRLQPLVDAAPAIARNGPDSDILAVAGDLGAMLTAWDIPLERILAEIDELHARLLQSLADGLRESDRALVVGLSQISQHLLRLAHHIVLAHQRAAATVRQSDIDALTGLPNRRQFEERVRDELRRAERARRPVTVVVLAVDALPRVNDGRGRAVGDRVLQDVAALVRGRRRPIDVASRLSDDEFGLLLPETDFGGATTVLQRLIAEIDSREGVGSDVHVSGAVAVYPDDGDSSEALLAWAERVLAQNRPQS